MKTSRIVVGLYRRRSEAAVAAMTAPERHRLCRRCHLVTGREEHRRVARSGH
ncbi:hypothetical protein [Azospirillum canadense]|uniref:hypothetical protein n=1 Tax=Azospirillum canadense TaxID=403962 RepID=UPI00222703A5|nr:hypothetical protein [Azospirillum canadense]MCW2242575.1 hypothetical protein [Azospirillum canadense]